MSSREKKGQQRMGSSSDCWEMHMQEMDLTVTMTMNIPSLCQAFKGDIQGQCYCCTVCCGWSTKVLLCISGF